MLDSKLDNITPVIQKKTPSRTDKAEKTHQTCLASARDDAINR